jgi:hypothetical protein
MPIATYRPQKLASAIAPSANPTKAASPAIAQLIDAREVLRLLTLHLMASPSLPTEQITKYCKATFAHLHHGGILTNMGTKGASGVIQPAYPGSGVFVRSLWLAASRDTGGAYWRAYEINGYKPESFPQSPTSRLVWDCLINFVRSTGQEPLGQVAAEYVDIAQEILSRGLISPASPVLLLTSSKQALSLVGERHGFSHGFPVAKVALRENAGQRVMTTMESYGWLAGQIEKASKAKQEFFLDMSLPAFRGEPARFLARWEYLAQVGLRDCKRELKALNSSNIDALAWLCYPAKASQSRHYPDGIQDCISPVRSYLDSHRRLTTEQIESLKKYLVGTGLGSAIAPVKLPVKIGVFNA